MAYLGIVVLSVLAAILYGIVHDQITARIALEYFTVGHPRLFDHDNPTIHALAWGVIATWWVGAFLGLVLASAARWGRPPQLRPREVLPYIAGVMGASAAIALTVGVVAAILAHSDSVHLSYEWQRRVSPEQHRGFLIASFVHLTSYVAGGIGAIVASLLIVRRRVRLSASLPMS